MSLHSWFGSHVPNHVTSHWDRGQFVTSCTICGIAMVKIPGLPWKATSSLQRS